MFHLFYEFVRATEFNHSFNTIFESFVTLYARQSAAGQRCGGLPARGGAPVQEAFLRFQLVFGDHMNRVFPVAKKERH